MKDYDRFSDQELAELIFEGDRLAFTQIFKKYNKILLLHAYKKLVRKDFAEDAVQEIFAMVWQKRQELKISSNLSGFLYTAIKNKCLDIISRQRVETRYVDSLQHFLITSASVTDHLVRERQMKFYIEKEISRLPTKMRRVFELSRNEHLSHKEIAEKLALSEQTVTDQIKKALKILRKRMLFSFFLA